MPGPQQKNHNPFKGNRGKAEGRACPAPTAKERGIYSMDYDEARKLVKSRLGEKRWTHTKNVKKMAVGCRPGKSRCGGNFA